MIRKVLSKLLPPKQKIFFSHFVDNAKICCDLATLFFNLTHKEGGDELLATARQLKRESNGITNKTLVQINATLITPIDREDLQNVNILLNKVARTIAKGVSFLKTYSHIEFTENLKLQVANLLEATNELKNAILKFKNFKDVDVLSASNDRMREIETRGDEIMFNAMSEIFSGEYDPLIVIKLRDLYKKVEKALDLCCQLSDTLVNISLKYS